MNVLLLMMLILYTGGGNKTFIFGPNLIVCYIKEFVTRKIPTVSACCLTNLKLSNLGQYEHK